jgi:hypothetical protein
MKPRKTSPTRGLVAVAWRGLFAFLNSSRRRGVWTIGLVDGSVITSEDCSLESLDPSMLPPNGDGKQTMRDCLLGEIRRRNPACPKTHTSWRQGRESRPDIEQEKCALQSGTLMGPCRQYMRKCRPRHLLVAVIRGALWLLRRSVRILSCLENSLANSIRSGSEISMVDIQKRDSS